MKEIMSSSDTSLGRTDSPSLTDIIEKFHKLKEARFKPKENPYMKTSLSNEAKIFKYSNPMIMKQVSERPSSATHKLKEFLQDPNQAKRRMSLPSIFRMETPPPLKEGEPIDDMIREHQSRIQARRYSTSHVLQEYTKTDIKRLMRAGRRLSVGDTKPVIAKPTEEDEENVKRWLTGDELHYFYNMWDKRKKPKIRSPRRLPPIHHHHMTNIGEEETGRPRLYTL